MSGRPDRKVVLALLGIAMLCLIGLGASLYHAKAAELAKLDQELRQKRAHHEEVRAKLMQMPELETQYAGLQDRLSVLEPALPGSAYIPTFLEQIEGLAITTQNGILLIRPKPMIQRSAADAAVTINDETGQVIHSPEAPGEGPDPTSTMPYDFRPIELKLSGTYWTMVASHCDHGADSRSIERGR
jgi:hypothetical protein